MTVKETLSAIRALGVTVSRYEGEYRLNLPKGTEATAYYTTHNDDALATARQMIAGEEPGFFLAIQSPAKD